MRAGHKRHFCRWMYGKYSSIIVDKCLFSSNWNLQQHMDDKWLGSKVSLEDHVEMLWNLVFYNFVCLSRTYKNRLYCVMDLERTLVSVLKL